MTEELSNYRHLQDELLRIRWSHRGIDSAEEDAHLETMDAAWWTLSDSDRAMLNSEPPLETPDSIQRFK